MIKIDLVLADVHDLIKKLNNGDENATLRSTQVQAALTVLVEAVNKELSKKVPSTSSRDTVYKIEFDLVRHIQDQREFSFKTFGPGPRTEAIIDHIKKELVEVEAKPHDLEEWVDIILMAIDGAWRSGHYAEEIAGAIVCKQMKNESRTWPDWRTADPDKAIEHIKEL